MERLGPHPRRLTDVRRDGEEDDGDQWTQVPPSSAFGTFSPADAGAKAARFRILASLLNRASFAHPPAARFRIRASLLNRASFAHPSAARFRILASLLNRAPLPHPPAARFRIRASLLNRAS